MHQFETRRNPNVWGAILIALGVLFLLEQVFDFEFFRLNFAGISWPLFPIGAGVVVIVLGLVVAKQPALTIVGAIITMVGLILWFQDNTGAFQTWAYAWALVAPTSIGLGYLLHGAVAHQPALISRGINLLVIGLALFGIGFTFFEFTINLSGFGDSVLGRIVGPVLLIGLGLYLLLRRSNHSDGVKIEVK